jgi:acetyl-CoA carboxylase carboxyl transferase subunit beta
MTLRQECLTAWDRVQLSRKQGRPVGEHYINGLFDCFVELHGDRYYADDKAVMGGIALFNGRAVTVIAQSKGKNTKENIARNFGMPSPEGYRKALRLMKQAEKFHRPIICIVDTPGAFCGMEAEERGQGEAIARNLYEMSAIKTPILSLVIGEGGSGGALAFAVADEVWMMENAVYSILSPEGYAAILWKDSSRAREAAELMKMTAADLKVVGMIEKVIREPEEFTVENFYKVGQQLKKEINGFLKNYGEKTAEELTEARYRRFRNM